MQTLTANHYVISMSIFGVGFFFFLYFLDLTLVLGKKFRCGCSFSVACIKILNLLDSQHFFFLFLLTNEV